jgi:hypothetical protein
MTSPSFFWPGRGSGNEVIVHAPIWLPPAQGRPAGGRAPLLPESREKNQIRTTDRRN